MNNNFFNNILKGGHSVFFTYEEKSITYLHFWQLIGTVCKTLNRKIKSSRCRVLVVCNSPLNFILSVLSIIARGDCAVFIDKKKTINEIENIFRASGSYLIITDRLDIKGMEQSLFLPDISVCDTNLLNNDFLENCTTEEREGCIIYTSGSTSVPKGVVRKVSQIFAHAKALGDTYRFKNEDNILILADLQHAYGFEHIMAAIYCHSSVYMQKELDYHQIFSLIKNRKINVLIGVPFHYEMLCYANKKFENHNLRLLISAGAPLSKRTNKRFYELYHKPITQLYGSSETAAATINLEDDLNFDTVGKAIKSVEIKIVTDENRKADPYEKGNIIIKSPYCLSSYLGESEYQYSEGFNTGDIGYLDEDNQLYLVGRKKTVINVAGKKVSPEEVEKVISEFENIKAVKVTGIEDEQFGEIIKATIITQNGMEINEKELLYFCRAHLANYKIPRVIVYEDKLETTEGGKIKR